MALVLTRYPNQSIHLGTEIVLTVLSVDGGTVRLGVSCPREIPIRRAELAPHAVPGVHKPTPDAPAFGDGKTGVGA